MHRVTTRAAATSIGQRRRPGYCFCKPDHFRSSAACRLRHSPPKAMHIFHTHVLHERPPRLQHAPHASASWSLCANISFTFRGRLWHSTNDILMITGSSQCLATPITSWRPSLMILPATLHSGMAFTPHVKAQATRHVCLVA